MFAIQKSSDNASRYIPNLLPCRINHNGTVEAKERYWKPEIKNDGTQVAYFRGRKLRGRQVELPEGYQGAILTKTEKLLPAHQPPIPPSDSDIMEEEEDEEDLPAEIKIAEASRTFDSFVVWGHESLPDSTSDPHVKGIEEWISFAEKMHTDSSESGPAN